MSLLQMSFSGAILILVIVVIRAFAINKLPKKTFLALWGIALLRLLIPFTVPASFSVYNLMKYFAPTHSLSEKLSKGNMETITPLGNVAAIPASPVAGKVQNSMSLWVIIWISGMLICTVVFTVSYLKCRGEFKTSLPLRSEYTQKWILEHQILRTIEIRQSDRISTPLTYGIFHPVILLPKTIDRTDKKSLDYILAHEYIHIRRFDTVTKLIVAFALCMHWFNPGVWVMYVLVNRDIELSCDEAVIRMFGESTRSPYAMAIIQMAEIKSGITPLCSNFSKNAVEERIVAIMKFKKSSFISLAPACAIVLTVGAIFATSSNATEADNTGQKAESIVSDEVILIQTNENSGIAYMSAETAIENGNTNIAYMSAETAIESGNFNNIPDREYVKAGIEWNRSNNAWFYGGKLVAALYDHNGGIYTCGIKAGESVTYLEVMRNKKGAIEEVREVTKDKLEKLIFGK